jgi:hypothetical protein
VRSDLARQGQSLVNPFTPRAYLVLTQHIGSIAAGLQAGIGNVAAGSLFAAAQSVAMGGMLTGVLTGVGTAFGGAGAGAAAAAVAVL